MSRLNRSRGQEPEKGSKRGKNESVGFSGKQGRARVGEEMQRIEEQRNKQFLPYRFRAEWKLDKKKKRTPNPVIFLDNSLDDAFFCFEHAVADAQGNFGSKTEICVKEIDNCPLCRLADGGAKNIGRSTYVMMLSVLDLRPYTNKNGDTVEYSRKLFVVKGSQIQDWINTLEKAEKKFGTLRGVYMDISRGGQKEAGTGKPTPLDTDWYGDDADGRVYANIDEDDLIAEYGHDAVLGDNKKVLKEADADVTAYDYHAIFTKPDTETLARSYGLKSRSAGSKEDIDGEWDEDEDEDEPKAKSARRSRKSSEDDDDAKTSKRSRRGRPEPEDDEDEDIPDADNGDDDEDDTPEPPARTRKKEAKKEEKPSRRRSRSEPEDEDDGEETEDDAEDEKPAKRTRGAGKSKAKTEDEPKSRKRKPAKVEEPEDEDDAEDDDDGEDDAPKRSRSRSSGRATSKRRAIVEDDDAEDDDDDSAF